VDFRSSNIENSGYQFKGSQRTARSKKAQAAQAVDLDDDMGNGNDDEDYEEVVDLDDDDLGFSKMALDASKKIKKKKGISMDEEKVRTIHKKQQKKETKDTKN
jgi:hypothetical protein